MDCSTPGFTVIHYLLEFAQTHVHWVNDAVQLSHSLLPPSPPALNLSQYQGLFQWVSSSHQVAIVLELQHQLPMNIQGWVPLGLTSFISLLSRELSKASVLHRSVFFMVQLSHRYRTAGKTKALTIFCLVFRLCIRQINWHPIWRWGNCFA